MAQVSFIASSQTGIANGATVAISKPTGTQDGDLMIAYFGSITGISITTLAGWTALDSIATNGSTKIFWRIASSEASSYSWTCTNLTNQGLIGSISTFRNTHQTAPLASYTKNEDTANDTTMTGADLTTRTAPNAMLAMYVHGTNIVSSVSGYSIPNNNPTWTEAYDTNADGNSTADTTDSMAYANYDFAQATGAPTATIANACVGHVYLLSIVPIGFNIAPPVFAAAAQVPTPTLGQGFAVPAFSLASAIPVPAESQGSPKWSNTSKHASTFTNQPKS